jgi:aspartyl-tRNA(Asn)/glutamyl-tRNA(Gln) amidotransferase subunit C
MALNINDINRLATLARLEFNPDQSERLLTQINDFFSIVEQMQNVDTRGIEPLSHPVVVMPDFALRLRPDLVTETDQRAANLRNAPNVDKGLFLVPKVIE